MNIFLIIISFVLHALAFFSMILLYFKIERMKDLEHKQATIMKDMEEVLSSYVLEIKEENERFLYQVKKHGSTVEQIPSIAEIKLHSNTRKVDESFDTSESPLTDEDFADLLPKFDKQDQVNGAEEEEGTIERLLESLPIGDQVELLYKNGFSIEEIAKKLNKGKTEIELFLKFNG